MTKHVLLKIMCKDVLIEDEVLLCDKFILSVVDTVIVYNSICVFQCCLLLSFVVIVCTNFH